MYAHETSTIDYEYQSKDKVKIWLEMATVDEEHSTICSPSIPDEEILDCVRHGRSIKSHTINAVSICDCLSKNWPSPRFPVFREIPF